MGKQTNIAWCDHTANWWWGCFEVSPECDDCYARQWDFRLGGDHWGKDAPRRYIKNCSAQVRKWNAEAEARGVPALVFASSMADVFEVHDGPIVNHRGERLLINGAVGVDDEFDLYGMTLDDVREEMFDVMRECRWLVFLLLTKRPQNIADLLPADLKGHPNLWLGTTVGVRKSLRRLDHLLENPAPVHFVSAEPQTEELDFRPWLERSRLSPHSAIDWIITGGESKQSKDHAARPYNVDWARGIIAQCREHGAAAFVKQMGSRPIAPVDTYEAAVARTSEIYRWPEGTRFGNPTGDVMLNGRCILLNHAKGEDPAEWPEELRVQERPAYL